MKTDSENTNFNLRHLRAVHAIWAEGSFARAADRLGVVPSALTETVRQIEEIAGGSLFDRRSRPPVPTPLGLAYLQDTAALLEALDLSLDRLRAAARGLSGTVRIGATPSTITPLVAPAIARFRRDHAGVAITVHDDIAETLADMVADGRLDLAVAGHARPSPELNATPIGADRFGLACAAGDPLAFRGGPVHLEDIDPARLIHLDARTGTARLLAAASLPEPLRAGPLNAHSTIAQLCLVRAGIGVALLPENAVTLFADPAIRFVSLAGLALDRQVCLLEPARRAPSSATRALIAELMPGRATDGV